MNKNNARDGHVAWTELNELSIDNLFNLELNYRDLVHGIMILCCEGIQCGDNADNGTYSWAVR